MRTRTALAAVTLVTVTLVTVTACGSDPGPAAPSVTTAPPVTLADGDSYADDGIEVVDTQGGVLRYSVSEDIYAHVEQPVYAQDPPVGGDHLGTWQDCGFYDDVILDGTAVHSIEHGAVWITYEPTLVTDADLTQLRDFTEQSDYVLVSPRPGQSSLAFLTAWGIQYQTDQIRDPSFIGLVNGFLDLDTAPEPGSPCRDGYAKSGAEAVADLEAGTVVDEMPR